MHDPGGGGGPGQHPAEVEEAGGVGRREDVRAAGGDRGELVRAHGHRDVSVLDRERAAEAAAFVAAGQVDDADPVNAFEGYDAVVTPSGSCAGSTRHQHAIVARRSGDPALQAAVAETSPKVYELSEFLVDVLGVEDVGAYYPHTVTYHPTCHSLRMLGVGDRPTRLLRAVRGLRLVELPGADQCCGFGGTFAVKNSDTSVAMGSDKARHVRETGAEVLVAGDNSCLMHVGGMLSRQRAGVRVMHLAEILAATESTEGDPGPSNPLVEEVAQRPSRDQGHRDRGTR